MPGLLSRNASQLPPPLSGGKRPRMSHSAVKMCPHCSGAGFLDDLKNAFDPHKNGVGDAFNKVKNEFTNEGSVLRSQVVPIAGQVAKMGADLASTAGLPGAGAASAALGALGYGKMSGKKRVLSAAMRHRNEVVMRVMREQNMKMIDASRYVKQHGLA